MDKSLKYFKGDELASSVWKQKYALKDLDGNLLEDTPEDMHIRLANKFNDIAVLRRKDYYNSGLDLSNISKRGSKKFYEPLSFLKIYNYFKDFTYIVPQGSIMSMLGSDKIGSLSNCFVVGQPEDSYGGIMEKDEELAQLMKRRGGVGIDISTLRPKETVVTNAAGTSTGAVSFMERYSNTTREVAQNGRRGALMISIDVRHPDVEDFATIKQDPTKVTGANVSIQLRGDFMTSVMNNDDYILRWPCDHGFMMTPDVQEMFNKMPYNKLVEIFDMNRKVYVKKIKATKLWETIIKCAHASAEPGLMFKDRHKDYSPDGVYPQYRGVTTNPCGEINMSPFDACRLLAANLYSLVNNPFTKDALLNLNLAYEVFYDQQTLADYLIDLELQHIDRILTKLNNDPESPETKRREIQLWTKIRQVAKASRRTGSGFTALGDMLAALGVPYDSDEGLNFVNSVMRVKFKAELDATIDMAVLHGPFEGWDPTLEFDFEYKDGELLVREGLNDFYEMLLVEFPEEVRRMIKHGRRNVSWSTVAPTGSVSILTQTTSGLEPLFSWGYMRRKKVNPGDDGVRVDFTDQNGDNWMEYPVLHPKFKDWYSEYKSNINLPPGEELPDLDTVSHKEIESIFEQSPWYGSTANDIDWVKRVEMQAIIQYYTTHSISTTLNLPNNVKVEEVGTIYMESWLKGLKGQTIYRDGCRSGVLVNLNEPKKVTFEQHDAPKRPKELVCDVKYTRLKGEDFIVLVGLLEDKPYELFIMKGNPEGMNPKPEQHKIVKTNKKEYILTTLDWNDNEGFNFGPITAHLTSEESLISRLISTSLRHGSEIKFIVEQLQKEGELNSFARVIARVLKTYIPDGSNSTIVCNECGNKNVIFQEGCLTCRFCGTSKCG